MLMLHGYQVLGVTRNAVIVDRGDGVRTFTLKLLKLTSHENAWPLARLIFGYRLYRPCMNGMFSWGVNFLFSEAWKDDYANRRRGRDIFSLKQRTQRKLRARALRAFWKLAKA